ncbi:MAG: NAD(P)/FAD-dependent oxidoreductase [Elusimicrobia bacterium]|nr:NAD(P)/FAD-dependent oxidoreductase [Elusimicrobiota bacterium]
MIWDAVVAGGGPAGLTAGFYLSRAGWKTLLIEKDRLGGQASRLEAIQNYPGFPAPVSGKFLMGRLLRQARSFGLRVRKGEVRSVRQAGHGLIVSLRSRALRCRAAILACGAGFRPLGLAGEKKLQGRGLYHAAFEEAKRFKGRTVGVVGGGETAAHQALRLARYARKVYVFCRGRAIKGIAPLSRGVRAHPRIEFLPGAAVRKLAGNGRLEGVDLEVSGKQRRVALDALFVLVGKVPRRPRILGRGKARVFTAGDARDGSFRQVVIAAADGMARAMECEQILRRLG